MSFETYRKAYKVRFSDSDPAGVMYFPRFLNLFHQVFEDWFDEELKFPYRAMLEDAGVGFPTVHTEVDYFLPFRFGETLEVELMVSRVGNRSFTCTYRARAVGEQNVRVQAKIVTSTVALAEFKAVDIPDELREALLARLSPHIRPVRAQRKVAAVAGE